MMTVHLIGIGGSGLSAIAGYLLEKGYAVSGSDVKMTPALRSLQSRGARIMIGHQEENIRGADLIVRSSAVRDDNVEILTANRAGIPVMKRAEFLGKLTEGYDCIAVAGTHGKTTTTALISWILTDLGFDPSYIIGGVSRNLGTNAHAGKGELFVIEADEYDRMFLGLSPALTVVTNVEHDHPDCFPSAGSFFQAFVDFINRLQPTGVLIADADDEGASRLVHINKDQKRTSLTYSISNRSEQVDYSVRNIQINKKGGSDFIAMHLGEDLIEVSLSLPGSHNISNALAALAVAHYLALPLESVANAIAKFAGTARRFEIRGIKNGVIVIDDYAHHPSEIRATLAAARQRFPLGEIWAVWQPHTFSRTKMFADGFAAAFKDANHVVVTDVFAARETVDPDFSISRLLEKMHHPDARYFSGFDQIVQQLNKRVKNGDVILVLSAGDADRISDNWLREQGNDLEVRT